MNVFFRKTDFLLLLGLLLLGMLSVVLVLLYSGSMQTVEISVNGQLYGSYPLSQNRIVTVETEFGRNVVKIADHGVSVTESDCTGHDCIRFGSITKRGQVIMCLPHRLIVSITGGSSVEKPEVDAVVY